MRGIKGHYMFFGVSADFVSKMWPEMAGKLGRTCVGCLEHAPRLEYTI
jgi:hypothetical protein